MFFFFLIIISIINSCFYNLDEKKNPHNTHICQRPHCGSHVCLETNVFFTTEINPAGSLVLVLSRLCDTGENLEIQRLLPFFPSLCSLIMQIQAYLGFFQLQ